MAIQVINIGSSANKGDGDPLRTAFKKINENFAELNTTNTIRDIKGSVFGDDSTLLVDGVNSLIPSSVLSGNLPAIDGSALTGITVSSLAFSNVTSKPTTIAGYGITDALALGTSSTTALAGDTSIPDGTFASLTSKPSTIAGYGITDAYTKTEVDNLTTTLDGDLTGSVFGDDSTLLVDGNNNKIVGAVDTTSLRTSETGIALGSGAGQSSGFYSVAIGYDAGQTTQGAQSIAIGEAAGKTTQSDLAVAIGTHAGYTTQGVNAIAIGGKAGETNQAANSIVINATGVAVNNIVADTFVVKPVREVAGGTLPTGFKTVGYNPTTGEFIYLAGV